jgi:DNA-binding transcriptional ArsR family regulator
MVDDNGCQIRVVHMDRVGQAREMAIPGAELDRLVLTYKVLGDSTRLKIVMALRDVDVSHQLRRLKDLALVKSRRDGQIIYYSLDDDHVAGLLNLGIEHVRE